MGAEMSIEAMKLALDCLEDIFGKEKIDVGAINALRQAIADAEKQESDDLTIAYMSGFHDGKNKDALQPDQEPVAMRYDFDGYGWLYIDNGSGSNWKEKIKNAEPLFTAPSQREWVGLTEEDKNDCLVSADPCECLAKSESHQLMEDVEAKLREKNGC